MNKKGEEEGEEGEEEGVKKRRRRKGKGEKRGEELPNFSSKEWEERTVSRVFSRTRKQTGAAWTRPENNNELVSI